VGLTQIALAASSCALRLARVFPRRTKATPDDPMAFFGAPDLFVQADEVHVDVNFTADKAKSGDACRTVEVRCASNDRGRGLRGLQKAVLY
jgi:hypothetical protein